MANRKSSRQAGFTLVELLVVLVILGLLVGLAGPRVLNALQGSRQDTAKVQIANFAQTLELYRLDNGKFPTTEEGLEALVEKPSDAERWNGPYLDKPTVPADPWGNPYVYKSPGEDAEFEIVSLGADNRAGGDGQDADISNLQ